MMKNFLLILLLALFTCYTVPTTTFAASDCSNIISIDTEYLEDGCYYETIISDASSDLDLLSAEKTTTKTKTTSLKNSSGNTLWSLSITATFTYDGKTSKCTSCTPKGTAPATYWTISNITSKKSGSTATAEALVTHKTSSTTANKYNKSVTISCSATGKIS